eukprot:s241_g5.t1
MYAEISAACGPVIGDPPTPAPLLPHSTCHLLCLWLGLHLESSCFGKGTAPTWRSPESLLWALMRPAAAASGSLGFADPGGGSSSSSTRPRRKLGRVAVVATLGLACASLRGHGASEAFDAVAEPRPVPWRVGSWQLCAAEGRSCYCTGTAAFHSLLGDWAMLRHVNGSIPCSAAFFGDDPRMGLPKLCSCMSGPAWPTTVVDGLNETIARKLLVRVEAGPADAGCSAEDDGKWTPCSVMSSRFDASLIPDRIIPRLPIEEQRDVALRKLDLCHNLAGPDQALRILGVWPSSIPLGVLPIKASSAPLCAVVYSPTAGAQWGSRGTIYCPTDPPKCLEGSCECAESSQSRVDIRHRDGAKAAKEDPLLKGQHGGSTASGRRAERA